MSFIEVEFPVIINLAPSQFHKDIYSELETAVKRKYSGIAHAKIGYVKRDSVRVVSKQMGKYEGSHLTGHMSFHLTVRCMATMPLKDMELEAIVIMKNDSGLVCKNFMYPYSLFVPNIPGDPDSANLASINTNDSIRVRVIDSRLKAPVLDSRGDRAKPEYWVICKVSAVNMDAISRVNLPTAERPNILVSTTKDLSMISEDQTRLTNGMFETLQNTKDVIDSIRKDYLAYLRKLPDMASDPIISSLIKGDDSYAIGIIRDHNVKRDTAYIKIINTNIKTLKINTEYNFNLPAYSTIDNGQLVILSNLNGQVAKKIRDLDAWLMHIKYLVNPNEMIHITNIYRTQLSNLRMIDPRKIPYNDKVISRAFYKMAEILHTYGEQLIKPGAKNIACIAESPGGFIQALLERRLKENDNITGLSVSPTVGRSAWEAFTKLHSDNYMDKVQLNLNGSDVNDEVGPKVTLIEKDITTRETIQEYRATYQEEGWAALVTADGGVDRDKTDSNLEELELAKLIMSEVMIALSIQMYGGSFVLKIFDMATKFTVDILSILAYCYEDVSIIKPKSSRPANSEKYVVCTGFKFRQDKDQDLKNMCDQLMEAIEKPMGQGEYYYTLLAVADADVQATIVPFNNIFMKKQTEFILAGREYATRYMEPEYKYKDGMESYIREQIARAQRFHSEIN